MVQSKISRCTGHTLLRTEDSSTLLFDVFSLFPHRSSEHIHCNASEIDPGGFFSDLALDTVTRYLSSERDLLCTRRPWVMQGTIVTGRCQLGTGLFYWFLNSNHRFYSVIALSL
jgi:hypothetical protein